MIIVLDTETQGLNARKFILGVLYFENDKYEVYNSKKKLYNRILELGEQHKRNKENLVIYAHNMQYDYISSGAWEDGSNLIYCPNPFIADTFDTTTQGELRGYIKWIDTCGLWRGSLESLGDALGTPKGKTPEWLKQTEDYNPSFTEMAEMTQYCIQDCRLLMHFVLKLKKKLWIEGIRPRHLITIGQVGVRYLLKVLNEQGLLESGKYGRPQFYKTQHNDVILEAYRGGRMQAFQTGQCASVHYEDINSLYPYAASQMEYPLLHTEHKVYNPLTHFTCTTLFNLYGVSHCLIETPLDNTGQQKTILGYLPIRQYAEGEHNNETTYYPETTYDPETKKQGTHLLLGTWTHLELKQALQLGYTIKHIFHSITWDTLAYNPLHNMFNKLYALRKQESNTTFDSIYYKLMMNSMIGKLAQRRPHKQVLKIDVEKLPEFHSQGWKSYDTHGTDVLIYKEEGIQYKPFYAPIIATYTTAYARDYLYQHLKRIPRQYLWYSDTDSIVYDSIYCNNEVFKYANTLGTWKREHTSQPFHVYRKKAYMIGQDVTLSRIPKRYRTPETFITGTIEYEDFLGINNTNNKELVGTTVQRTCELNYQTPISHEKLLIDTRTTLTETHWTIIRQHLKE